MMAAGKELMAWRERLLWLWRAALLLQSRASGAG